MQHDHTYMLTRVSDSVSQTLDGLMEALSGPEKCAARSRRKEMSSEYSLYPLHQPKVYSGQSVTYCLRIKFGNESCFRLVWFRGAECANSYLFVSFQ